MSKFTSSFVTEVCAMSRFNSEFSANNSLAIEAEIKAIQKKIREHVGIVPNEWYDRLDQLEMVKAK